jgi:hypothetical protein
MIEFDGISFNALISRNIMAVLADHDPSYVDLAQDQVANRVTRYSFMAAIARINDLPFFPRVAEFCDGSLHVTCDSTVMTRGLFAPICLSGTDKLVVAIANPWSALPEEYLAPRFPNLEIIKVVTVQVKASWIPSTSKTSTTKLPTSTSPPTTPNQWHSSSPPSWQMPFARSLLTSTSRSKKNLFTMHSAATETSALKWRSRSSSRIDWMRSY